MVQKIIDFLKRHVLIFCYFVLASLVITYPLIFHMTNRLPGLGDELLITWIMNWNIHAFLTDPMNIFQANIFYPYHNTLAYSDVFFTASIIGFIPSLLVNQPAFIFNFTLLFSLVTLGFCTHLLVEHLTGNNFAGIISGTLIAFSTFTMTRLPVVQLIGIAWVSLSLLFYFLFLEKKQFKYLFGTAVFFLIQIYNSFLPGYFLLLCYSCITLVYLIKKKISPIIFLNRNVFLLGLLVIVFSIPLIIPYLSVSKEVSFHRDIRDAIHFGNRPEYSLYPSDKTRLKVRLSKTFYAHDKGPYIYEGYIGFSFLMLLFFLIFYFLFIKRKFLGTPFIAFSVIAISAYILSLGPAFQWGGKVLKIPFIIPLPYALFYYLVPGFNGMRNSARWEFLALFALSILIGIVLADAWRKQKVFVQFILTGIICLVTILEYPLPLPLEKVAEKEEFPMIYSKVANLPQNKAIIELPLYSWRMAPFASQEFLREYYTTSHFRKMVNGYSGFSPPEWEEQAEMLMQSFPERKTLHHLKSIGVHYIILHQAEYERLEKIPFIDRKREVPSWSTLHTTLEGNSDVTLLYHKDGEYIYELL
jgi:hypothetical protein